MKENKQCGAITLEACVSVLTFILLALMLSSLFVMFMAQNTTAHTVLQASESLSVDVYRIEALMKEEGKIGSIGDNLGQLITKLFGSADDNPAFVTDTRWYTDDDKIEEAVKTRFIGYLIGENDTTKADEYLKQLNIVNGLNGLDFSESYVSDDTLYIVLKYKMQYDFNIFDLGEVEVEQRTCSKLWKDGEGLNKSNTGEGATASDGTGGGSFSSGGGSAPGSSGGGFR